MPISIGQATVNLALNIIQEDDLVHFDFRCPKCKKTNKVSKKQLLHAAPGWKYEPIEKPEKKDKEQKKSKPEPKTEVKTKKESKTDSKAKAKPAKKPKAEATPKPKNKTKAKKSSKK
jgi:hypothetical protein